MQRCAEVTIRDIATLVDVKIHEESDVHRRPRRLATQPEETNCSYWEF
jgi:hypothetical protein